MATPNIGIRESRQVDLSNLRIKKPEEITSENLEATKISDEAVDVSEIEQTLTDTGKEFETQALDMEITEETLPTFNIAASQEKQETEQVDGNQLVQQALSDIKAGMPMDQFDEFYPELKGAKDSFLQLSKDIEAGIPDSEIPKFYPELFGGAGQEIEEDIIEEKPGVLEVAADTSTAFDVVISGISQTGKNLIQGATETSEALFRTIDKLVFKSGNIIREAIGKKPLSEEEAKAVELDVAGGLDTKIQEDLLDIGKGSLQLGLTSTFPVATLAFTTAGETEEGEKVLQAIGGAIEVGGKFINKLPGLREFRESLPEDRRADFDAFVGQAVTLGLFKAGSKISEIKAKWNKANEVAKQTETAGKILRPTKGEIQKGVLESGEKGLVTIAKETQKDVKDFSSLAKEVPKVKSDAFAPLKKGLDDAQAKLFRTEKTGLTKDSSVTFALEQLKDVTKDLGSKKMQPLKKEIDFLIKKNEAKGLTLNEIQKVKQLHTENNKLFTDKGEIKGKTISKEDLREIRIDIKKVLEDRAKDGGFKKVQELNTRYGEILNAEQLIKQRLAEVKATGFKTEVPGPLAKTIGFILDLPIVNQFLTKPGQAIFNKFNRGTAERTISIIELETQLPKLLKELRQSGEPKGNISKIVGEIRKTYPALSQEALNIKE